MRRLPFAFFVALSLASTACAAPFPLSGPALITEPDCGDSFTMDVRARSNPETLGTVTWDGYPVLLGRDGAVCYVMPRGDDLPYPVLLPRPSGAFGTFSDVRR